MYALEGHEENGRVGHDNKIVQVFSVDSHSDFYLHKAEKEVKWYPVHLTSHPPHHQEEEIIGLLCWFV